MGKSENVLPVLNRKLRIVNMDTESEISLQYKLVQYLTEVMKAGC